MTGRPLTLGAVLALALSLAACSRPQAIYDKFLGFGTLVEITIYTDDPGLAERALTAAHQDFAYMHDAWHAWHPGPLGRINGLIPTGEWFSADPTMVQMIQRSQALSRASGGLFNPAIGGLLRLWGFQNDEPPAGPPPAQEEIDRILAAHPSMDDLVVEGIRVRSRNPAVRLDFGAFAKGYGIDRVSERFQAMGIEHAIVNAGGDLRAWGRRGERPWRIGVRHPQRPGVLASIETRGDESIFTSGDYERYFEWQGERYHHILDPRTGYPTRGLTSVTVIDEAAADADAAATALLIAGPEDWPRVARDLGIDQVMVVESDGRVRMTPSMVERVHFEVEPARTVLIQPLP